MNKKQKIYLWIGIIAILSTGIFPPWLYEKAGYTVTTEPAEKRFCIFSWVLPLSPNKPDDGIDFRPILSKGYGVKIDIARLFIEWFMIFIITAGLIITSKTKSLSDFDRKSCKSASDKRPDP